MGVGVMWSGDGQAAGAVRRVRDDDAEEESAGGQHRCLLDEARPRRETHRRPRRREGRSFAFAAERRTAALDFQAELLKK